MNSEWELLKALEARLRRQSYTAIVCTGFSGLRMIVQYGNKRLGIIYTGSSGLSLYDSHRWLDKSWDYSDPELVPGLLQALEEALARVNSGGGGATGGCPGDEPRARGD